MPGRRKRRKSRKQSLVFTESPIHNQRHVPTPVLCVDNPVTAKVVPVEADQTWVSPQFREIKNIQRDNKHVRKYHSTIVTRSRHPSNKENTSAINENYRNKYKSLKFLGESSDEASSDNISFDSPTPANVNCGNNKTSSATSNIVNKAETWSLRKLKNSRKSFEISFTESLNSRTPIRHHVNHSMNVSPGAVMTTVKTRVRRKDNELESHTIYVNNNEIDTTPKSRRSARLQPRFNVLFKTPPRKKNIQAQVLVCDTPESEYGLSVRERRLKRLNKSRS